MYAIATFLVVGVISLALIRLAAGALVATGLPPPIASFQARSAFSGAGFTTKEAENVVNHPLRRRIIGWTMTIGTLGTPTLVVTVIVGFVAPGPGSTQERALVAIAGFLLVFIVVLSRPFNRLMLHVGELYARSRLLPALGSQVDELLLLGTDHVVVSVPLREKPEGSPRSLRGLETAMPGVKVLGVRRDQNGASTYIGSTPADLTLHADDELVLYATRDRLRELELIA